MHFLLLQCSCKLVVVHTSWLAERIYNNQVLIHMLEKISNSITNTDVHHSITITYFAILYRNCQVPCPHAPCDIAHVVTHCVMLMLSEPIDVSSVQVGTILKELVGEHQSTNASVKSGRQSTRMTMYLRSILIYFISKTKVYCNCRKLYVI